MSFRSLREARHLSQERLAEMSGLSLRTVQRLEAGHRVSYASLRSLAATFDLDVDRLERELYAVNKPAGEFVEMPRWIRRLGNGLSMGAPPLNRRQAHAYEAVMMAMGMLFLIASFLFRSDLAIAAFRAAAVFSLVGGYGLSIASRVFDTYQGWPSSEAGEPTRQTAPSLGTRLIFYALALLLAVLFLTVVLWLAA